MPLLRNRFQPYFPDPMSAALQNCSGEYCYPTSQGDNLFQQWFQTPCENNLIPDPQFTDLVLGSELITNGTFASGASWIIAPGGSWALGGGVAVSDASFGNGINIEQTGLALTPGAIYQLSIDVSGLQPGDFLEVFIGGLTPFMTITTNGTAQLFYSTAGGATTSIVISADSVNDITITNVSLQEVTYGSWANNGTWVIADGVACKGDTTLSGDLQDISPNYVTAGGYYSVTFTIDSYAGTGTVTPVLGDTVGTPVSGNGTYTQWLTATNDGTLVFTPTAAFIGCISFPLSDIDSLDPTQMMFTGVRPLRNDFTATITKTDGSVSYALDAFFTYFQYYVTLIFNYGQLASESEDDFGCYQIEMFDSCLTQGNELIINGNFSDGDDSWQVSPPTQFAVAGAQGVFIFDPITGEPNLCVNGDFSSGAAGWTSVGWTIAAGQATHNIGNTSPLSRSVTIGAIFSAPAYKVWWIQFVISGRTAGSFTVMLSDGTMGTYSADGNPVWRVSPTIGGGPVTFLITPTSDFDGSIDDIIIVEQTTPWQQGVNLYNVPANPAIVAGNYVAEVEIISLTTNGYISLTQGILGMSTVATINTTTGIKSQSITNYVPGTQLPHINVTFQDLDPVGGINGIRAYIGEAVIDNVSLIRVEPFEATYISECIDYQQEHINTRIIRAYSDQSAYGFDFANTGFFLQQRVECRTFGAFVNKQKLIAEFGTGNAKVAYAEATEFWPLHTGLISESAHMCLAAQIDQDHLQIGVNETVVTEYVAEGGDYSPQWNGSGSYDLATAVFNIRLKDGGQLYNRHV